jgi:hypothetical protein
MFAHEVSNMCKFDQKCTKNVCYYRYTKSIKEGPVDEKDEDENETVKGKFEACESCGKMFDKMR